MADGGRDLLLDPEIIREPDCTHAANGRITLTVLDRGRVFKRRAIKGVGAPGAQEVCWLVAELDGVRLYVNGDQLVLSTQDLMP